MGELQYSGIYGGRENRECGEQAGGSGVGVGIEPVYQLCG